MCLTKYKLIDKDDIIAEDLISKVYNINHLLPLFVRETNDKAHFMIIIKALWKNSLKYKEINRLGFKDLTSEVIREHLA